MRIIILHKRGRRFFKFILILGISIILLIFYFLFKPTTSISKGNDSNKTITLSSTRNNNYELFIQNSIFKGVNKDFDPFIISASKAIKIADNQYNLDVIEASYKFNKNNLLIKASKGFMNDLVNFINLQDNVQIILGNLILNAYELQFNLINKEASSKTGVELFYKRSKIRADNFHYNDEENIINFNGHVFTRIKISDF